MSTNSETTRVERPWGEYCTINGGDYEGFKVKKIIVRPGCRLSLQSHANRSEHWVIAQGVAKVQLGDEFTELRRNHYIYIPVNSRHRIENIGNEPLVFIETQIGDYLGEDDITRYEDDYNRA